MEEGRLAIGLLPAVRRLFIMVSKSTSQPSVLDFAVLPQSGCHLFPMPESDFVSKSKLPSPNLPPTQSSELLLDKWPKTTGSKSKWPLAPYCNFEGNQCNLIQPDLSAGQMLETQLRCHVREEEGDHIK